MLNLKIQKSKTALSTGFTLIELMVVTSIMLLLASSLVINLAGQRVPRDLKIAQNELVSNIRKTQSYMLSSRILANGKSAQYYLIKFDLNKPTEYKIQAIYDVSTGPKLIDVETINFPPNIQIATTSSPNLAINITRFVSPTLQPIYTNCALVAFVAPYGKIIFNDGCSLASSANPADLVLADDYYAKIINFQNNLVCSVDYPPFPTACSASTDSIMTITVTDKNKTKFKSVSISSITGAVTFN